MICASRCASSRRPRIFRPIHHELGHNFYQRAYDTQPPLFRNSANDGFHEAIGDTIALSVTPEYLKQNGLLENVPPESADIGILMHKALEKVAFLPFGLLIDKWRWEVFSGKVTPADYNKVWWELREKYQGVKPPVARTEAGLRSRARNITSRQTSPTLAISWRTFCSSNSTARSAGKPATRARSIAVRSTTIKQRERA